MSETGKETAVATFEALADLITSQREILLMQWREQVRKLPSAKGLDAPTLDDHIPLLLDELIVGLRSMRENTIAAQLLQGSPPAHGQQRQHDRFDISEVVAEYNILRNCISDCAETHHLGFGGKALHILNRVFDEAIGLAVQTFATQQALEVQQRREEYLAFVAHDLRTPLNAISLAARVLESKSGKTVPSEGASETNQMFRTLHRNVKYLEGMVDRILKESEQTETETGIKLQRRRFDLWPLVEALIHDLDPIAGTASTEMINEIPGDLMVDADAGLLIRIFQNLIANAIRHTPRGKIVIGAREDQPQLTVECWVQDNGSGIPADQLEKIFEKRMTDTGDESGLGLGLAIVKTFVEAHGGEVTAQSDEGAGSTFRFTLPSTHEASPG